MANYGLIQQGIQYKEVYAKFTLSWDAIAFLLGATTSGNVTLFTLPQAGKVTGVTIKHSQQFTGITGPLTVSLGIASNVVLFTTATIDLVANAVADNTLLESGGLFNSGQLSKVDVVAHFISSSGAFTSLTAGSVDLYVKYLSVSTPNV